MKFESHWPKGLEGDIIYSKLFYVFLFKALADILFIVVERFKLF